MKLTKSIIEKSAFPTGHAGRFVIWDDEITGLGLRIYPSSKKAFILSYRIHKRKHLYTIGLYGRISLDDARRAARIKLGEIVQGNDPLVAKKRLANLGTVAELCAVYLERHAKPHKKTWSDDQRMIRLYILPSLGTIPIKILSVSDVANLHLTIGNRSKYVANRTMEVLRCAIEKGKYWGFLDPMALNPASRIQRFKEEKRDRWLNAEELPRVASAIALEENVYVKAAIWLYLLTGVRKSELLKAKWSDVDLSRKELRLEDTKNGKTHYVPLSSPAVEVIKTIPRLHENPFLIPGLKPGAHMVGIARPWMRIRNAAGVRDVRLHDLRRTVGSWLAQNGASLHLIGKILNHSSTEATRVYARFGQDSLRDALESHGSKLMLLSAPENKLEETEAG